MTISVQGNLNARNPLMAFDCETIMVILIAFGSIQTEVADKIQKENLDMDIIHHLKVTMMIMGAVINIKGNVLKIFTKVRKKRMLTALTLFLRS